VPAADAAVSEQRYANRTRGQRQVAIERLLVHWNPDHALVRLPIQRLSSDGNYTAKGKVSGTSPASQPAERSSGSTARVSSKCSTASNWAGGPVWSNANVTAERRHLRDCQASVCSVPLRRLHQQAVLRRDLLSNRVQSAEAAVPGSQDDKPATER
jgi:hypothetical protein